MTQERRYQDEEVREIFALATTGGNAGGQPVPSHDDGLTLEQLQDVGVQVGLTPAQVASAASALDIRRQALPQRRHLGRPVSVGRIVDLPRAATEREWELLVAELRRTFDAKGEVTSHGSLREWSNGNLHAFLEPTDDGHRLRLTTFKGQASALTTVGVGGLLMALIMFAAMASKGKLGLELVMPMVFAALGAGALISNAVRLPRWAGERERQMEYIADRARALLESPPDRPTRE